MRVDLSMGFSQIRSQGHLGSCAAFAASAILEYIRNRSDGNYTDKQRFYSPRFIYFISRFFEDCATHAGYPRDKDAGSHPPYVAQAIMKYGACDEDDWDYRGCERNPPFPDNPEHFKNKFAQKPTDDAYNKARQLMEYVSGYEVIPSGGFIVGTNTSNWIEHLVKQQNPIHLTIETTNEFHLSFGTAFFNTTGGGRRELHAVVVAGYDSKYPDPNRPGVFHKAFLIRNSWGADWGINGSMWVAEEALRSMSPMCPIVFKPKKPFVPFNKPTPPTPIPTPPTPGPTPTPPKPSPPPTPPPLPTPPPSPYHPKTRKGDFAYQWWLFDSIKQFNDAVKDGLGTHTLHSRGIGMNLDTDPRRLYIEWDTSNFVNNNPLITDPAYAGKIIGLGACRTAEITGDPAKADGKWRWTYKRIKTSAKPDAIVFVKEKGKYTADKGSEVVGLKPGSDAKKDDVNFIVRKKGKPISVSIRIHKKRSPDEREPDPKNDPIQPCRDWNLNYTFASPERKQVTDELIELPPPKDVPILLSFKVPSDAEPGKYYIMVKAYHNNEELDWNYTEFKI